MCLLPIQQQKRPIFNQICTFIFEITKYQHFMDIKRICRAQQWAISFKLNEPMKKKKMKQNSERKHYWLSWWSSTWKTSWRENNETIKHSCRSGQGNRQIWFNWINLFLMTPIECTLHTQVRHIVIAIGFVFASHWVSKHFQSQCVYIWNWYWWRDQNTMMYGRHKFPTEICAFFFLWKSWHVWAFMQI